jgi:hypothetical protein
VKHSELLREAYKYIEDGRELYICYAVGSVCRDTDEVSYKVRDDVETYISDLLGKHSFYDTWLFANCEEAREMYRDFKQQAPYQYKLKLSRMAWIEWMIAQYEAKGM